MNHHSSYTPTCKPHAPMCGFLTINRLKFLQLHLFVATCIFFSRGLTGGFKFGLMFVSHLLLLYPVFESATEVSVLSMDIITDLTYLSERHSAVACNLLVYLLRMGFVTEWLDIWFSVVGIYFLTTLCFKLCSIHDISNAK